MLTEPNKIRIRRLQIEKQIVKQESLLRELQENCPHKFSIQTAKADVGNYDTTSDKYWWEHHCPHCDKKWRTPQ